MTRLDHANEIAKCMFYDVTPSAVRALLVLGHG